MDRTQASAPSIAELVSGGSNRQLAWPDIVVDYAWLPPWEGQTEVRPNRVKVVFSSHENVAVEHEGLVQDVRVRPGSAYLMGTGATRLQRIREHSDTLDMYPDLGLLNAEAEARGVTGFAIEPTLGAGPALAFDVHPIFLGLAHKFRQACIGTLTLSDIDASDLACRLVDGILSLHGANKKVRTVGKLDMSTLRAVFDCVEENLTSKLSLPFLAGLCDLSPWHFAVQFKAATGMSPGEYVLSRRLELAKRLVLTTDLSVWNIGWSVGFENISHFRRKFRSHVGFLPGELRRATRQLA
jgi:AraC family transcriptional regulator